MAATCRAGDLCARHSKAPIGMPRNSPWYGIKKCGPSTSTLELRGALVERRAARCTPVDPRVVVLVIFTAESGLRAFLPQDLELLGRENGLSFVLGLLDGWRRRRGGGHG